MALSCNEVEFAEQRSAIRAVREAVFIQEQGVPESLEMDDRDMACKHALLKLDNVPIGTGRIDIEKAGKVGRVAILGDHRNKGYGRIIMNQLEATAQANGLNRIWFHAQISALPFYERLGYTSEGDLFEEAGIQHVKMTKVL